MRTEKLIAICMAVLALFCSCTQDIVTEQYSISESGISEIHDTENAETSITEPESAIEESTAQQTTITTIEKIPVSVPEIEKNEFSKILEAETASLAGNLKVDNKRQGYSGSGYLTGFDRTPENLLTLSADIPYSQHYDITVCSAAENDVSNTLVVNGKEVGVFKNYVSENGKFSRTTFYGVYIEKGNATVSVKEINGAINLDYVQITNNKTVYDTDYSISESPCNPEATEETKALYHYLKNNYGKRIITGQYSASSKNLEIQAIQTVTGRSPAIRFGDLTGYSLKSEQATDEINSSIKWAEQGGIVGLIWHWVAPYGKSGIYAEETDFDLKKAVTGEDISMKTLAELEEMKNNKQISEECYAIVRDIDNISEKLKELQDKKIPVIWRPLNEAGGKWFWWGSDKDSYIWLWNLLYKRQTNFHKLNNLIWVWNGQSKNYCVDENTFDIASIDIYLDEDTVTEESYVEQFQWLNKLTGNRKLIALSECQTPPDPSIALRDSSMWIFEGMWYGDYLVDKDGNFVDSYITKQQLSDFYNSTAVITLDDYKAGE